MIRATLLLFVFICLSLSANSQEELYCKALISAYSGQIQSCSQKELLLKNQVKIPYQQNSDSMKTEKMMEKPSVKGLFFYDYWNLSHRQDAGRIRVYGLLNQVYGENKKEIQQNLLPVKFLNQKVLFNKQNRAAESLEKVGKNLAELLKQKPQLKKYIYPADTYYYRKILGTNLLSAHSYGIAVDLNPNKAQYWQTTKKWEKVVKIFYPLEIVQIFEKHGFIWGGRWHHFDSMHFEYRPEFLELKKLRDKQ